MAVPPIGTRWMRFAWGIDLSGKAGKGRQVRRIVEFPPVVRSLTGSAYSKTRSSQEIRGGSEMRSLGRLACLAAAGLFVVTALEAQKAAPKSAPVPAAPVAKQAAAKAAAA